MAVFISHSSEDTAQFDNIADALAREGIEYWDPSSVQTGRFLSEQLREAISDSAVCIFIATHRSVGAAWCVAELGAFWGAGKPVLVYLADSSLDEKQLPPQFQGYFVESRIRKVIEAAKRYPGAALPRRAFPVPDGAARDVAAEIHAGTVIIVTGCHHSPELLDRPCAYQLKALVDRFADPAGRPSLASVVLGDIWFLDHSPYADHLNVVSVGGPGSNALTVRIAGSGETVWSKGRWRTVRQDNRWAVFGDEVEGTREAVVRFADVYLADWLRQVWSEPG